MSRRMQFRVAYVFLALSACVALSAFFALTRGAGGVAFVPVASAATTPPSASEFEGTVMGTANSYAVTHGEQVRVTNAHCVEAAPGKYMCAYAVVRPGKPIECHIMQATWTPGQLDSYKVTLSGRAGRCGTLREAIRSLS